MQIPPFSSARRCGGAAGAGSRGRHAAAARAATRGAGMAGRALHSQYTHGLTKRIVSPRQRRTTDEGGDQAVDQNRPRTFLRPFITGGGGTLLNSIPHSSQSFLRQQNSPTGKKTIAARHPHGVHVGEQHSLANSVS